MITIIHATIKKIAIQVTIKNNKKHDAGERMERSSDVQRQL